MEQYSAKYFKNFQHFFGVVEDRQDPLKMGRVRVRAFGVHTEDRSKIPTADLPWATPIMPYTSASISGVGESPTGPVEGTWVFGFFVDGKQMQQPMIMGTLAGAPEAYNELGFNDPNKVYPKIEIPGESDVNRLARGDAIRASTIEAPSVRAGENILAHKKKHRVLKIPKAGPPGVESDPGKKDGEASTIKDGPPPGYDSKTYYSRRTWNEPNPRYGGKDEDQKAPITYDDPPEFGEESIYPLNHVKVTESGHVFEVDDSPKAERIAQYHTAGTFYEIQPNGTRVTKIVGDDYEMVMHDKNMVVKGNVSITVQGSDVRLLVQADGDSGPGAKGGNMFIETDGDLNLNVRGDMTTKVGGTVYEEYLSHHATNVSKDQSLLVNNDRVKTIIGDHTENNRTNYRQTIKVNENITVSGNSVKHVNGTTKQTSLFDLTLGSKNNFSILATSNVNIQTESHFRANTAATFDVQAIGNIELDTPAEIKIGKDTVTVDINGIEEPSQPILVDIDGRTIDVDGFSEVDIDGTVINLN
jgi:hypothetical protein